MKMQAETGIAQIIGQVFQGLFTTVPEMIGIIGKFAGLSVYYLMQTDRFFEVQTKMKELSPKAAVVVGPQGPGRIKPELLVIIP